MHPENESSQTVNPSDEFWNDQATLWPLLSTVIVPPICLILNIPSLCGPRVFDLGKDTEQLSPLFLAFGLIGCVVMARSVLTPWLSLRLVGRLAGALFAAGLGSAIALFLLLPNLIGLILSPHLLIIGCIPYISVAFWANRGRTLLDNIPQVQRATVGRRVGEGVVVCIGLALAVQVLASTLVTHAVDTLVDGELSRAPFATQVLQAAVWCDDTCNQPLRRAFNTTNDPNRQQVLREAYRQREGKEIDALDIPAGCY